MYEAERTADRSELTGGLDNDRVRQRIIRFAFYDAGTAALGYEPPWGALTGVRPVKLPTRWMADGMTPEQAKETFIEDYRVTPGRAELAMDCAVASLSVKQALRPDELSLYIGNRLGRFIKVIIHIPFYFIGWAVTTTYKYNV